ncbi:hypothetical protein [Cetobacterium sp.]|uniref:hypothetical protein n=1 Tax=Cetobacterium sp. TaxID=2071632 RepID=UPI003F3665E0
MFKKGDYVRSINHGYIVLVDKVSGDNFSGIVVESDAKFRKVGSYTSCFDVSRFKIVDYEALIKIRSFIVPKILETIKNDVEEREMENKIKIDDKAILRTDIAFQVPFGVNKGTILNVDLIEGDKARVSTPVVSFVIPLELLIKVEEEKETKEDVRVVRKLEDLDLCTSENKKFKIFFDKSKEVAEIEYIDSMNMVFCAISSDSFACYSTTRSLLEELGFKFEYKPTRSEEEILKDLVEKEFDFHGGNYTVGKAFNGTYTIIEQENFKTNNTKYYTRASVAKVVKELNELLEREIKK